MGVAARSCQCVVKVIAGKLGRAATGSPQPPPGGGLLLNVASPSARLRACLGLESVRQDRAGRSLGAAEARNSRPQVRSCVRFASCSPI